MESTLKNGNPIHKLTREEKLRGSQQTGPAKSLSAKLREMKKKGDDNLDLKDLAEIMTNPELSALDIIKSIRGLKKHAIEEDKTVLLQWCINQELLWHQTFHGRKLQVESKSVSLNVDITHQDFARIAAEVQEERRQAQQK